MAKSKRSKSGPRRIVPPADEIIDGEIVNEPDTPAPEEDLDEFHIVRSFKGPHVKTTRTIAQVERMVACGLDSSQIAYCLGGISGVQVEQEYKEEIEHGAMMVVAQVGAAQIRSALRGDSNAAQFFLRARAKWVTPTKIEQDVTMVVEDRRKLMDEIVKLTMAGVQQKADPAAMLKLIESKPTGKAN